MTVVHKNIHIQGSVQGVYFRGSMMKEARSFGITGFVRNEPDGSVYAEAEGEEEDIYQLIKWCKRGPAAAHVTAVNVEDGSIQQFSGFQVVS